MISPHHKHGLPLCNVQYLNKQFTKANQAEIAVRHAWQAAIFDLQCKQEGLHITAQMHEADEWKWKGHSMGNIDWNMNTLFQPPTFWILCMSEV